MPKKRLWINNVEAVLFIMAILIIIGTINVFSSSFVMAGNEFDNGYYFVNKHLISLLLGIFALVFAMRLDYRVWRKLSFIITVFAVFCLIAVFFIGIEVNGSKRWIQIGMTFQPSEVAKLASLLLMASYLGPKIDKNLRISIGNKVWLPILLMGGLVYKQPDLGTAAIIVGIAFLLYIMAGLPLGEVVVLGAIALGGAGILTFSADYRIDRVKAWFDPWSYESTSGYQTVQSLIAIGSGGFSGLGLGMGTSKFAYLPEAHTDFAFSILCQEMGFIGAFLVLILLAAMAWYCGRIAKETTDGFGKMLVIGIAILVVGQGVANIAMVIGILPVIGVPLPFISYGGTSLIVNMLSMGILASVGKKHCSKVPTRPPKGKMPLPKSQRYIATDVVKRGA
ncbi:FtsW/RodA/SpoVE family cell cycle protein [Anaerosinus sp.]|uniref:FtsW/RodA/SpoVE family cell cycle protein n=1 Tax=Selenobaculum sp. TaxID=3074374 RepID=UPI0015AE162F